jgi:5-methylcytosine-specific restriction endonuclease McrA
MAIERLDKSVLVLNQNYEPVAICNVKKAIILIYLGKAEVVEQLASQEIRAVSISMPFPSVVRLQVYIYRPYKPVILNRKNILRRDRLTCQYCGKKNQPMTVDHIIPKQFGGKQTWENLVCACVRCNNKKRNRTPEQAGMKLLKKPGKPTHLFFLQFFIEQPHHSWRPYLFLN